MKGITRVGLALVLLVVLTMTVACTSQYEQWRLVQLENPDSTVLVVSGQDAVFLVVHPDGRIVHAVYALGGGPVFYHPTYMQPFSEYLPIPPCP